jgi:predicted MFS family arabinose efflux permease
VTPKRIFWLLFALNLFNYIDRQVLFAVFPLIQKDLSVNDLQLGALASAFMMVYMCYAPLAAYFSDRTSRPKWIGISALIWSAATMGCTITKNFAGLIAARGLIGIGEGGFTTIAQPFLAEHYPKEKHASVLAKFGLALPVGCALGYILGGFIGQTWGWRSAFMLVGIPGVFLGLLALRMKDPLRQNNPSVKPSWREYKTLFTNRPFLCVCLVQAMTTFVLGGFSAWIPTYLLRYLDMNVAKAGFYFGVLVIVCGAIGTYAGGKVGVWWKQKSANGYYHVMTAALLAGLPAMWLALYSSSAAATLLTMGLAVILLFLPTGAIAAALVETTPAEIRVMAFAVNIFLIHLLGDALSPTLIGWISDVWNLRAALFIGTFAVGIGLLASRLAITKTER